MLRISNFRRTKWFHGFFLFVFHLTQICFRTFCRKDSTFWFRCFIFPNLFKEWFSKFSLVLLSLIHSHSIRISSCARDRLKCLKCGFPNFSLSSFKILFEHSSLQFCFYLYRRYYLKIGVPNISLYHNFPHLNLSLNKECTSKKFQYELRMFPLLSDPLRKKTAIKF